MKLRTTLVLTCLSLNSTLAHAQLAIDWYTIDCGGGTSAGGSFSVSGTIGQPDVGDQAGGALQVSGGFWPGAGAAPTCYANCDGTTTAPILNINDFQCFINLYAAGNPYANCDGSTSPPTLNVNDFQCFLNKFAAGCS